jgi:hypothetical protein
LWEGEIFAGDGWKDRRKGRRYWWVKGFGVLQFAPLMARANKGNDNCKYRGLSTTAAKCAAFGRDDVFLGRGRERTGNNNGNSSGMGWRLLLLLRKA